MKKHAYLIIAHGDPALLNRLVKALDYTLNDIYIHIDRKSDINSFSFIKTNHSPLTFVKNRIDVRWGDSSQIEAEYALWKEVAQKNYDRLHLISGADYPLHSQQEIHDFFDQYPDEEFINFEGNERSKSEISHELYKKCRLYHILLPYIRHRNKIIAKSSNFIRHAFMALQIGIHVKRKFYFETLYKGSNWVSVTQKFVNTLLKYEDIVKQDFRLTHCSDEVYKQTIAMHEDFNISQLGNLRHVDFERGTKQSPYTFGDGDYNLLCDSKDLFARKFSSERSSKLIDQIESNINNSCH